MMLCGSIEPFGGMVGTPRGYSVPSTPLHAGSVGDTLISCAEHTSVGSVVEH